MAKETVRDLDQLPNARATHVTGPQLLGRERLSEVRVMLPQDAEHVLHQWRLQATVAGRFRLDHHRSPLEYTSVDPARIEMLTVGMRTIISLRSPNRGA